MGEILQMAVTGQPLVILFASAALLATFLWAERGLPARPRLLVMMACGAGQAVGFMLLLAGTLARLDQKAGLSESIMLAISALAIGFGLWLFRKVRRAAYGAVEIVFAVCAASAVALTPSPSPLANTLALAASVYVVVRGLDNIDQGIEGGLWARLPLRWPAP